MGGHPYKRAGGCVVSGGEHEPVHTSQGSAWACGPGNATLSRLPQGLAVNSELRAWVSVLEGLEQCPRFSSRDVRYPARRNSVGPGDDTAAGIHSCECPATSCNRRVGAVQAGTIRVEGCAAGASWRLDEPREGGLRCGWQDEMAVVREDASGGGGYVSG